MNQAVDFVPLNASPQTTAATELPVVIIGGGPVGTHAAQLLASTNVSPVILYSNEPWHLYNRVRLSALLAGQGDLDDVLNDEQPAGVELRLHSEVTHIDRAQQTVTDAQGRVTPYQHLILATGAAPHIPTQLQNIDLVGIYTFRDLNDVQKLLARQMRSRSTIVLGGGVLGLEAARAMRRAGTQVTVIHHSNRLMSRQLDEQASKRLLNHVTASGIQVMMEDSVEQVIGERTLNSVRLLSGRLLACDTLIIATGIRPRIQLARQCGLSVRHGIRVNDQMQTNDPSIYAIGECAEHNNTVYGLVMPGLEQAAVAVNQLSGTQKAHYHGTTCTTRLKVLEASVFSMGEVDTENEDHGLKNLVWSDADNYRKLTIKNGRLSGAMAIGEWAELPRIQEAVQQRRHLWFWQQRRFMGGGSLWGDMAVDVTQWAASTVICQCTGITRGQLSQAIAANGCQQIAQLSTCTGAGSVCGSCRPLLGDLLGSAVMEPVKAHRSLLSTGLLATILTLFFALPFVIPYPDTVQVTWQWDQLWRNSILKQITGFSLLGISVIGLIMSLRKRIHWFGWGDFAFWRLAHVMLGTLLIFGLIAHTGGRLGDNLNAWLMLTFLGLLAVGGISTALIALEHRLGNMAIAWRKRLIWAHILLFWPLPVLLGFHVLKTYYY